MDQALVELLEAGETALRSGRWPEARRLFEQSLEIDETPEGLFGLGYALWWSHDGTEMLDLWERAYRGFRRNGDLPMAVAAAVQLSLTQLTNVGNTAAAVGWAARADRICGPSADPLSRGWVCITLGSVADDPAAAEEQAHHALEIATRVEDRDLELCAIALLGSALVDSGRATEGVRLLDEAMAGALGEAESLDTVVFTSCVLVQACYQCADFGRVVQWTADLEGWISRYGSPYVNAVCRAHYGAVLVSTGDWTRAEDELAVAVQLAGRSLAGVRAETLAFLAELRLAQGRTAEAADLIAPVAEHKAVWPVAAAIRLARGLPAEAAASAARQVQLVGARHLVGSRLREVHGEALLRAGEVAEAEGVGRELAGIAAETNCDLVSARASRLLGRALAASGDAARGAATLADALRCFDALQMPLEVARTRVAVGQALLESDRRSAVAELRLAEAACHSLGAGLELAAAEAALRAAGETPQRTADGSPISALTSRERDVLGLVAQGLSNPEIAERLYLSRRTVEHHVASVLSKLGLRNRTEAAGLLLRG